MQKKRGIICEWWSCISTVDRDIDGSFLYFFKMSAWTLPPARFYTRNTSITHWQQMTSEINDEKYWHLMKYNDAFHLYDIGTTERIPWGDILNHPASDAQRPSVPLPTETVDPGERPVDKKPPF